MTFFVDTFQRANEALDGSEMDSGQTWGLVSATGSADLGAVTDNTCVFTGASGSDNGLYTPSEGFDSDHQVVSVSGVQFTPAASSVPILYIMLGADLSEGFDSASGLLVLLLSSALYVYQVVDGTTGSVLVSVVPPDGSLDLAVTRVDGQLRVFLNSTLVAGPLSDPTSVGADYRSVLFGATFAGPGTGAAVSVERFSAGDYPDAQFGVTKLRAVYDEEIPLVVEV